MRSLRFELCRRSGLGAALAALLVLEAGSAIRAGDAANFPVHGQRIADFRLADTTGTTWTLSGLAGKPATVLVFFSPECPVSNVQMPRVVALEAEFRARGVQFLGIDSNARDSRELIAQAVRRFGLTFPVLQDAECRVADCVGARRTPEVAVLDGQARLRYRGRISDQYRPGAHATDRPVHDDLKNALDAVLAGRPVAVAMTEVAGCPIDRGKRRIDADSPAGGKPRAPWATAEPRIEVGPVTFAKHVAPILQAKCQACHRPGQPGPMTLMTYRQVRGWADSIQEVIEERRMPPWQADPRYGHFANDRSLAPAERATLLAWIRQGMPAGDPKDQPPARKWPEGWSIGKPDVVFTMATAFTVPASGTVPYQYFEVPTHFTEDRWVQAAECRPGNRKVVHHIIAYIKPPRTSAATRAWDRDASHFAAYAPGDLPMIAPPGTAKLVPAGATIVFQVHYTPNGTVQRDQSSVGMIFAKEPVRSQVYTHGIAQPRFRIPPGAPNYQVESDFTFAHDATLSSFMPHMHLRGKDFKYVAIYPNGATETLLSVPAYDFAFQSVYRLARPRAMPRGTRIHCTAHFDNSAENPSNPDPRAEVRFGEQTWDEMMIGYIDFTWTKPMVTKTPPARRRSSLTGSHSRPGNPPSGWESARRELGGA